mmetsp:Transcript_37591/g.111152  ORF Transcript_37591/g.111152 Transcript_37591/m.111152 type:complete len:223 (+) Transcript_37591:928-1596(+)
MWASPHGLRGVTRPSAPNNFFKFTNDSSDSSRTTRSAPANSYTGAEPATTTHFMPSSRAASTARAVAQSTMQRSGGRPMRCAACERYHSTSGAPPSSADTSASKQPPTPASSSSSRSAASAAEPHASAAGMPLALSIVRKARAPGTGAGRTLLVSRRAWRSALSAAMSLARPSCCVQLRTCVTMTSSRSPRILFDTWPSGRGSPSSSATIAQACTCVSHASV